MNQGKIKCPNCERYVLVKELQIHAETDADEGGVYVTFVARCPYCFGEVNDKRVKLPEGYLAPSNDEPLRWET